MEVKPARPIFAACAAARARRDARRAPRADPLPDCLRHLDPAHAAAVHYAAIATVKAADRPAFYRRVEAALQGLPTVGDGALHRILKAACSGQYMPKFDARSSLDRIKDEDEDAKAAASSLLIASAAPDR